MDNSCRVDIYISAELEYRYVWLYFQILLRSKQIFQLLGLLYFENRKICALVNEFSKKERKCQGPYRTNAQCELRDRKTNIPHITLSAILLTILFWQQPSYLFSSRPRQISLIRYQIISHVDPRQTCGWLGDSGLACSPSTLLWLGKDPSVGHIDRPASRRGAAWPDWMVYEGYQLGTAAVCIRLSWGDDLSGRGRRDGRTGVVYFDNTGRAA